MTFLKRPALGLCFATGGSNASTVASIGFDQTEDSGSQYDSTDRSNTFSTPILGITRICGDETQTILRLSQYCASDNETDTTERKYVFSGRTCDENDTQYTKGDSESYCRNNVVKIYEVGTAVSSRKWAWLEWTHLEFYRVT
jgi:hypothetical protein|tara:strand:+ start:774 stop:1199 length:426 start_codon:yes stop_codon:yes gene_type:complete